MSQDNKFELVKTELELVYNQIDKFDNLCAKIKTWSATIWLAISGWVIQTEQKDMLFLSVFILIIFWFLDAVEKNYRMDYKNRKIQICDALSSYYKSNNWPDEFVSPVVMMHDNKIKGVMRVILKPHISLLYTSLIIVNLIIYIFI